MTDLYRLNKFLFKVLFLLVFLPVCNATSHHPQEFLKAIQGSQNEGEQIYQHFCTNCHAKKPIIPLGAPRIGMTSDWSARLKQDIAVLYKNSDEGLNAMPPRGGCFECTDLQLVLAIVYLLPENEKKDILINLKAHLKSK